MGTTTDTTPWDYATPKEPKTELWWTLGAFAFLILLFVAWGPTTAAFPPMLACLPLAIGFLIGFVGVAASEGDGAMAGMSLLLAAIVIAIAGSWSYSAYHKQNIPFGAKAFTTVANENGGKIAFATGEVHGPSKRSGAWVEDNGHFHGLNQYNRETNIADPNVRGWGIAEFEKNILDKHMPSDKREILGTGKMTCFPLNSGTMCVQKRGNGQYYSGTYRLG